MCVGETGSWKSYARQLYEQQKEKEWKVDWELHAHAPVHANVHVHTHWQIHTHVDVWALTHKTIRTCPYTWTSAWIVESLLIHMNVHIYTNMRIHTSLGFGINSFNSRQITIACHLFWYMANHIRIHSPIYPPTLTQTHPHLNQPTHAYTYTLKTHFNQHIDSINIMIVHMRHEWVTK